MSKKNKKKQQKKVQKKPIDRKKILIIASIAAAVALLVGAGLGIYAYFYNQPNSADGMSADERYEYSYVLTIFGRHSQQTANDEVLIVDTVTKSFGGDTQVTFHIYRYTWESDLSPALRMTKQQLDEHENYTYMGKGTVTMIGDDFAGMSNMQTMYIL